MKVGDRIRCADRHGISKVVESRIVTTLDSDDKPITKVSYLAIDEKARLFKFYGYDINKRVFKVESTDGEQSTLFE